MIFCLIPLRADVPSQKMRVMKLRSMAVLENRKPSCEEDEAE